MTESKLEKAAKRWAGYKIEGWHNSDSWKACAKWIYEQMKNEYDHPDCFMSNLKEICEIEEVSNVQGCDVPGHSPTSATISIQELNTQEIIKTHEKQIASLIDMLTALAAKANTADGKIRALEENVKNHERQISEIREMKISPVEEILQNKYMKEEFKKIQEILRAFNESLFEINLTTQKFELRLTKLETKYGF